MNKTKVVIWSRNREWQDKQLCRFICVFFLTTALNILTNQINFYADTFSVILKVYLGLSLVLCVAVVAQQGKIWGLLILEFLSAMIFAVSVTFGDGKMEIANDLMLWNLGVCIPVAYFVFLIHNKEVLFAELYKTSWLISLSLVFVALLRFARVSKENYDMALGYYMLTPVLIQLSCFLRTHKTIDLLCAVVCSLVILFLGSRGPLACIAVFVLLIVCFEAKGRKRIALCITVILLVVFYTQIIDLVVYLASAFNVQSRSIRLIQKGSFQYLADRDTLYSHYIDLIMKKPFFGWGLTGGWISSSIYPHNILIELCLSFGLPIGLTLIIVYFFAGIAIVMMNNCTEKALGAIFLSESVSLLFSGTFLSNVPFFIVLAIAFGARKRKRLKPTEKNNSTMHVPFEANFSS